METSFLTILPNLSIGVISVLALVYITIRFLQHLDERAQRHEKAMGEREQALREVEKEIRSELNATLKENNVTITENSRIMSELMHHLKQH